MRENAGHKMNPHLPALPTSGNLHRARIVTGPQALRLEKERLERERDKKIDTAIRRIQRERLEFEETSKAEAEQETRRLDEASTHIYKARVRVVCECVSFE